MSDESKASSIVIDPGKQGTKANDDSSNQHHVTINFPSTLNTSISGNLNIKTETLQTNEHEQWYNHPDFWIASFTGMLVFVTAILARYTWKLWDDAHKASARQAREMNDSIAQSIRSASAMEDVAKATKNNAALMQEIFHKQIRAYIAVDIGVPTCQDGELRFATAPIMTNTGFTPARNVSHKIMSDILNTNITDAYKFDESAQFVLSDAVLSPRQQFVINSIVDKKYPIEDVPAIMQGKDKRLFVWGTITYEDIFGNSWETNFCHNFIFFRDKNNEGVEIIKFLGYYYRSHNQAT
ncbi:MAG: hypothetical protein WBQ69_13280 [Gallionella sp.]